MSSLGYIPNEGLYVLTKTSTSFFKNVGLTFYGTPYSHNFYISQFPELAYPGYLRQPSDHVIAFANPIVGILGKASTRSEQLEFTSTGDTPEDSTLGDITAKGFFFGTYGIEGDDQNGTAHGEVDSDISSFGGFEFVVAGDTYKLTITQTLSEGHI